MAAMNVPMTEKASDVMNSLRVLNFWTNNPEIGTSIPNVNK